MIKYLSYSDQRKDNTVTSNEFILMVNLNFSSYEWFSLILCYRPTAEEQGWGEYVLLCIMLYSVISAMGTSTSAQEPVSSMN